LKESPFHDGMAIPTFLSMFSSPLQKIEALHGDPRCADR
jgi:hypothetical protein